MARIETKVTAGSLAAAAAGAAVWALQIWVFHGSAVPDGVVALVYLAAPAALAAAAGYLAPHTNRPALTPVTQAPPLPPPPLAAAQPPGATPPPPAGPLP